MKDLFKYISVVFVIFLLFLFGISARPQEKNIVTGRVFPAGMQTPMRDVKVQVLNRDSIFTITDNAGKFSIIAPDFPVYLVFSKETYKTQTVKVKKPVDIVVYLIVGRDK